MNFFEYIPKKNKHTHIILPFSLTDFIFEPIIFGPTTTTLPLSLLIYDDAIPETRERFTIVIESVRIADGREGMAPQFSGMAEVDIYDNDCKKENT